MVTCRKCGTKNKTGAVLCQQCGQPLPLEAKQTNEAAVIEQIPNWLTLLLAKYGEHQGPLVGLEAFPMAEDYEAEPAPGELSNLLEQMAHQGPLQGAAGRTSTSVEWGPPPEKSSSDIDDLLANFEVSPDSPVPPYTKPPAGSPSHTFEAEMEESEDVPDWLSEALSTPPTITDLPTAREKPASPTTREDDSLEVPDWLAETIDTPAPSPAPDRSFAAQQPAEASEEIPDWLETTTPTEPVEPTQDFSTSAPATETLDIPDWLAERPSTPPAAHFEENLPAFTGITDTSRPEWLAEEVEVEQSHEADQAIGETDIPAWIGSASPTVASDEYEVPDWLAASDPFTTEQTEAPAPTPAFTPAEEPDDWLAGLRQSLPDEAESFLPEEEAELTEPAAAAADEIVLPDWLVEQPGAQASSPEIETGVEEELPDWLSEPKPEPAIPESGPAEVADEEPDWLTNFRAAAEPGATPEPSDWGQPQPAMAEELPPAGEPDWLADLSPAETSPPEPGQVEVDLDEPDWLADLPEAAPRPPADRPAAWTEPSPPEPAPVEVETEALPDWLAELPASAPDATQPEPAEPAGTTAEPDWLADLQRSAAGEAPEPAPPQPDVPDWLAELPPTAEASGQVEPEQPDWLAQLQHATPQAAEAGEIPEWSEVSSDLPPIPVETETPPWLAELQQPAQISPGEETPAAPTWLDQPVTELEDTEAPEADEGEGFSWLTDVSMEATEEATEDSVEETAAITELPPWLAEITEAKETPEPEAEVDLDLEEEPPLPYWLSDLASDEEKTPPPTGSDKKKQS